MRRGPYNNGLEVLLKPVARSDAMQCVPRGEDRVPWECSPCRRDRLENSRSRADSGASAGERTRGQRIDCLLVWLNGLYNESSLPFLESRRSPCWLPYDESRPTLNRRSAYGCRVTIT